MAFLLFLGSILILERILRAEARRVLRRSQTIEGEGCRDTSIDRHSAASPSVNMPQEEEATEGILALFNAIGQQQSPPKVSEDSEAHPQRSEEVDGVKKVQ